MSCLKVIVPTMNAAMDWPRFAAALLACVEPRQVLIIDSESTDGTRDAASLSGFEVCSIRRAEFNHGGTRQLAADMLTDAEILVYLTQDAILSGAQSISSLVSAFNDPSIAVAYGRQLPRSGASTIEAHARLFNYPSVSEVREIQDRPRLGFKTIFVSNSFAAYRRTALMEVGGFPGDAIFGEDTITVAKLLMAGHKVAYVAEATVYHSHQHSWAQELKRYFDIGVLHSRERWLLEYFGGTNGEGARFVRSELNYLLREDMLKIPDAILRTVVKYLGYRLGRMETKLSRRIKRHLSLNGKYWSKSDLALPI